MRWLISLLFLLLPSAALAFVSVGAGGSSGPTSNPPLINCSSFVQQHGNCGMNFPGAGTGIPAFNLTGAPNGAVPGISGTQVLLVPTGGTHNAVGMIYQPGTVPVGKFTAQAVWVNNDWNFAMVWNNTDNQTGNNGASFASGAGCEGGFFQGFSNPTPPDNVFAIEVDQTQNVVETDSGFTYSAEGIFQSNVAGWSNIYVQCPCVPMSQCGTNNTPQAITSTQKVSTSPLAFNSPPTTGTTGTGHTYSMTANYDGTTLSVALADVTVGGSFNKNWTVNIPTSVNGTKAWFGVVASTNAASALPLLVNSVTYSVPSPL